MSKMIQIRNVPDRVHRMLKARAAQAGLPLSDYLLRQVTEASQRPTLEDVIAQIRARGITPSQIDSAAAVRAERESR